MTQENSTRQCKLVLVGDGGVGKTAFVLKKLNDTFEKRYIATLGVEVHQVANTYYDGEMIFNIWDTAGQEKFGGLREGYYISGDCCIVMCDITSKLTMKSVDNWIRSVRRVCDKANFEIVIVANKTDVQSGQKIEEWNVNKTRWESLGYKTFECSVKNKDSINAVFDYLQSKLQ